MSRESRKKIATENMDVLRLGFYTLNDKKIELTIPKSRRQAVEVYTPDLLVNLHVGNQMMYDSTNVIVNDLNSFDAAWQMRESGRKILVLSFANAYNPGGGYLRGANAQEEVLCRQSSLYQSISGSQALEMYEANKENVASNTDLDYLLLSKDVEVFRRADGSFLPEPYQVSVMSLPAPNTRVKAGKLNSEELGEERRHKFRLGIQVAAKEHYDTLILGAWGCGAFGNPPKDVANDMYQVLVEEKWMYHFKNIVFAVYDTKDERPNYNAFLERFGDHEVMLNPDMSDDMYDDDVDDDDNYTDIEDGVKEYIPERMKEEPVVQFVSFDDQKEESVPVEKKTEKKEKKDREIRQVTLLSDEEEKTMITRHALPALLMNRKSAKNEDLGYIQGITADGRIFLAELYDEVSSDGISLTIVMDAEGFSIDGDREKVNDRFKSDIDGALWKKGVIVTNLIVTGGGYGEKYEQYTNEVIRYLVDNQMVTFLGEKNVSMYVTQDANGVKLIAVNISLKCGRKLNAKTNWEFIPFDDERKSLSVKYMVDKPEDGSEPDGYDAGVFTKHAKRR